jgi:hypothetical protein
MIWDVVKWLWRCRQGIGILATLVGLAFVYSDHHALKKQLAELVEKEVPLAVAMSPDWCTTLPSGKATTIKGYFLRDAPEKLYAALLNGADYYISTPPIQRPRPNSREWSLDIYPGKGIWTLYFLDPATPQARKALEDWQSERVEPGANPRRSLPPGTKKLFVEYYTCS